MERKFNLIAGIFLVIAGIVGYMSNSMLCALCILAAGVLMIVHSRKENALLPKTGFALMLGGQALQILVRLMGNTYTMTTSHYWRGKTTYETEFDFMTMLPDLLVLITELAACALIWAQYSKGEKGKKARARSRKLTLPACLLPIVSILGMGVSIIVVLNTRGNNPMFDSIPWIVCQVAVLLFEAVAIVLALYAGAAAAAVQDRRVVVDLSVGEAVFAGAGAAAQSEASGSAAAARSCGVAAQSVREDGLVYELQGIRGRHIKIYEDRAILNTKAGVASLITGNATDGEKTIYFSDVIGVQFKKSGLAIGYLQLETASSTGNNRHNNFFNENTFTFDTTVITNEEMEVVAEYVRKKVAEYKRGKGANTIVNQVVSSADELKKFKDLLDAGVITQEEFDVKKKELLGL